MAHLALRYGTVPICRVRKQLVVVEEEKIEVSRMKNVSRALTNLFAATSLCLLVAGCSSLGSADSTTNPAREAGVLASRLCILNDTGKTIPMIRELGPYVNGDHHPDPEGPLAPGATWCTNGYDSYSDSVRLKHALDVTAQILFTADGKDRSNWGASNESIGSPLVIFDTGVQSDPFLTRRLFSTDFQWETDVTMPQYSQPNHDYHIRRLDDSEFFKEWLITVRR
jgi:hypothetical protein